MGKNDKLGIKVGIHLCYICIELRWVLICVTFEYLYLYSAHSVESTPKFLNVVLQICTYVYKLFFIQR